MCLKPCEEFESFENYLHKIDFVMRPAKIRKAMYG
jgi:hypothetical protein